MQPIIPIHLCLLYILIHKLIILWSLLIYCEELWWGSVLRTGKWYWKLSWEKKRWKKDRILRSLLLCQSRPRIDAMEVILSSAFLVVFRFSGARLGFYWLCGRYFKTELVHTNCILACWWSGATVGQCFFFGCFILFLMHPGKKLFLNF